MQRDDRAQQQEVERQEHGVSGRRGFLGRLLGAAGGVFGGGVLAGFSGGSRRGAMHGPVRPATAALQRPRAVDAAALLGAYADGRVLERMWAVAHVARGPEGALVIVLVDGETGGHAELELWARGAGDDRALQLTPRFALHLPGESVEEAPAHLQRVAARVATVVRRHEAAVTLQVAVPRRSRVEVA